jgi:hypothetical protein
MDEQELGKEIYKSIYEYCNMWYRDFGIETAVIPLAPSSYNTLVKLLDEWGGFEARPILLNTDYGKVSVVCDVDGDEI